MRGYGRDYDDGGRKWIERAGGAGRGWFGAGHDYDRDYGWDGGSARGMHRDWDRGRMGARGDYRGEADWRGVGGAGGGDRVNNWNNQHATRDAVERAGGYYGMGYEDRGGHQGGGRRGSAGSGSDCGRDYNTSGWGRGGMTRGMQGGMSRGGMSRGTSGGGGMRDPWMAEAEREDAGYGNWGDYNRGAYGGQAFRNNR